MINTPLGTKSISDVRLVPEIDQNLLNVGQLLEKNYSLVFKSKTCMIMDPSGQELVSGAMIDRCFVLDVNLMNSKAYASSVDDSCLWHKRLGHVNYRYLSQLYKFGLIENMSKVAYQNVCEVCQLGK